MYYRYTYYTIMEANPIVIYYGYTYFGLPDMEEKL